MSDAAPGAAAAAGAERIAGPGTPPTESPMGRGMETGSDPAFAAGLTRALRERFPGAVLAREATRDGIATLWIERSRTPEVLDFLKTRGDAPFPMLYDLTAVDERSRRPERRPAGRTGGRAVGGQDHDETADAEPVPRRDYTAVYHLLSLAPYRQIRLKVPLDGPEPSLPSVTGVYSNANWYEREGFDLFGIRYAGHPYLRRILLPPTWVGHPLRKDHPARATEMEPFSLDDERARAEQEAMRFRPEDWGMADSRDGTDLMFLNLGPNHPSVHGVFRVVLQLDGEEILDAVPEIGFHHRAAEKMGERQTWHTYIPYTDRVDYLGGVMNKLPYVLAVERLAGIRVPPRVEVVRIMLCELFRIGSHLLFLGTMAQDLGQLSPVFYMFSDRQRMYDIMEAITGFRMHPAWFRIGGLAQDLPEGWDRLVRDYIEYQRPRLDEYERMVLDDGIFRARTRGVGALSTEQALEWGVTGPNLRATGLPWDLRKAAPYAGYDRFDFEIPVGARGDCFDRVWVHLEEMRQSLRIVRQCLEHMPPGEHKARHPLTTPPLKQYTMHDIETLIHHFVEIGWGPVIPPGEACATVEGTKGLYSYYLTSDGDTMSYRTRIRTASFPHLQVLPEISRGHTVADMIAILGSLDFVMADVDR